MTLPPDAGEFAAGDDAEDAERALAEAGWIPPDPDEPPPVELWRVAGGVLPWGTMAVLLGWGAAFLQLAAHGQLDDAAAAIAHGASVPGVPASDAALRLIASTFLHAGPAHVFLNALSLLVFGPALERLCTRWAFWIVYAGGGAAAALGSLLWRAAHTQGHASASLGGSGAVFALAGAVLAAAYRLRDRLAPGRARALAAVILLLSLPSLAAGFERRGTDNAAHAAGLVAGALLGLAVPLAPRVGGRPAGALTRALGAAAVLATVLGCARALIER